MVGWFASFLVSLAVPPLLIIWFGVAITRFVLPRVRKRRAKALQIRNANTQPRGYPSGQALINNRRSHP